MKSNLTDQTILKLLKSEGSMNEAFRLLVKSYSERLYWHIRKMVISHDDTNDILQNTFIKAYQAIDRFRGDSAIYTWLYRIAVNETLNFIEQQKRRSASLEEYNEKKIALLESESEFSGDALQKKFHKAIQLLPEKQRLVFNMKYFDQMKFSEISEVLQTSVGALKASYHHAVKKIEDYLLNHDD
ncbi:MAG TPA: sigma-70 family RNA polymerase sigma factor [Salinivirgaceae bacterium]|nr:sigma-70 family RNA polymerase sigma factor [Salinivirgaceae bacterium]